MTNFKQVEGTYQKSNENTKYIIRNLIIALIPLVIFSFLKNGLFPYLNGDASLFEMLLPLTIIIVAVISSLISELIYAKFILKINDVRKFLSDSNSGLPGLFFALILPLNTPISIVVIGSMISSIIGKMIFGGFGQNIFNPALIGRLFIFSAYGANIISNGGYLNPTEIDAVTSATPLSNFSTATNWDYSSVVEPYGNLFNFLFGTIPGSLGETSALLMVVGFIYMAYKKILKFLIPIMYILTVFVMTFIIGAFHDQSIWFPLFHILSGGLMFGAIYMATDPVTSPITKKAHVLYGIFLGVLTVTFRFLTPEPEGVLTSILTMNMFVFIIDKIGVKSMFNFKKYITPLLISIFLVVTIPIYVGFSTTREADDVDPNFTIINREEINNEVHYEVSQKGYVGNIIASVVIVDGEIEEFEIVTQNESFWHLINDNNFVNKLFENRKQLETVDTISNATITSEALKMLLINTLNDYNEGDFSEITGEIEKDYKILNKQEDGENVIYKVSNKGFVTDIVVNITLTNEGEVINYEVVSHEESYYQDIIDADYTNYLVDNYHLKEEIDTVSGATITSDAMKEMLLVVLEDFANEE